MKGKDLGFNQEFNGSDPLRAPTWDICISHGFIDYQGCRVWYRSEGFFGLKGSGLKGGSLNIF